MRRYFLGAAAGWAKSEISRQRRETGTRQDTLNLCDYLCNEYDGKQAIVTRNGRSAIAAALEYYYLFRWEKKQSHEPRGEVVINGFTCRAVVQGVEAAGFKPVYADIENETLNFTIETLEKVITNETKAIIVQNTLGNMVDVREIEAFCKKHDLILIEDLAHSVGRFYPDGREAGKVGEIAVFSFGKEKSIDVVNGGAVVFRNPKFFSVPMPQNNPSQKEEKRARMYPTYGLWYRRLSYLRLNGIFMRFLLKKRLVVKSAEGEIDYKNSKLPDWQAKLALEKLKKRGNLRKRPLREFYLVRDRVKVLEKLRQAGYYFDGFWYEKPVSPERYYKKVHFPEQQCPTAVEVARKIVNLPSYYDEKELLDARKIIEQFAEKDARGFIGQKWRRA